MCGPCGVRCLTPLALVSFPRAAQEMSINIDTLNERILASVVVHE